MENVRKPYEDEWVKQGFPMPKKKKKRKKPVQPKISETSPLAVKLPTLVDKPTLAAKEDKAPLENTKKKNDLHDNFVDLNKVFKEKALIIARNKAKKWLNKMAINLK